MNQNASRRVMLVVMDGIGVREDRFGNAVKMASTPVMNELRGAGLSRTLLAHGPYVGLPDEKDIGNSEVGHNALGAGRVFDQGAKLVSQAIESGRMFAGEVWKKAVENVRDKRGTMHFIGLLSDGNVHSHEAHLFAMLRQAGAREGVKKLRVHPLFDGRDVGERSAEIYVERLSQVMAEIRATGVDIAVASGGGRMQVTMDRYEADWRIVERGWKAHVLGEADTRVRSLEEALAAFRKIPDLVDQNCPPFVVVDSQGKAVGTIEDGDSVIFFNFRGDRAIEISKAFTQKEFSAFDRKRHPKVFYAGMMQYDGDTGLPEHYLVTPPEINGTLSEVLVGYKLRQFACSETQKFGHVTYFWNGNRSGYINESLEEYLEITSDKGITFDLRPWMKAEEICEAACQRLRQGRFDFLRVNFANGDMVGHTGSLEAAIVAVGVVDLMVGRLWEVCRQTDTILVVTADHGNADEMFDAKAKDHPDWEACPRAKRPAPKTAHTINPVPFMVFDPRGNEHWQMTRVEKGTLAHVANTVLTLLGKPAQSGWEPSLIAPRG